MEIQAVNKNKKGFVGLIPVLLFLILPIIQGYARLADPVFPVKGIVIDSVSGEGISYVTIQIENNDMVVQRLASDESGKFSFTVNTRGSFNVLLHSVGYQTKKTTFETKESVTGFDLGKISLIPSTEKVKEVTVSALKPLVRSEAEKLVYNVESDPQATTSNALDILRKVPLVSVDGEDKVQLRGMSGVKFLINGKSSVALNQNTREVLKNMPANTIKDIEVITNPSSKYEAEGNAGVINIITTRRVSDGYNGNISAGINTWNQNNGNLNFTSKINKVIYSLNTVVNHFESPVRFNESARENFTSTTNRFSESKGIVSNFIGNWGTLNSEASYEIDTMNLVSISFNGNKSKSEGLWLSTAKDYDISNVETSGYEKKGRFIGNWKNFTGTFDYQKLFKRKDRILTLSYRYDHELSKSNHNDKYTGLLNFPDYWQKIIINTSNNEQTLQLDYVDPISKKSQIETGFKQIWRKSNSSNNRSMFDNTQNDWVHSNYGSNTLDYTQSVTGVYLTFQLKFEKGIFKAGLRAENTVNDGIFNSMEDTTFTNKMFNLVPFLLFSKDFEKGKSLNLSYTKRLARPRIWLLNPYIDDTDPKNINMGNPRLETEVSNNFDFSFSKFSEKFNISINMNAAFSNNLISDISTVHPNGIRITTYKNIGNNKMAGGNVYGSVQATKKLNINATVGLNYTDIESNNNTGIKNSGWSTSGNFNLTLNPWKNGTLLASAGTSGRRIALQGIYSGWPWSSITYQHEFFNKKMKLEARIDSPLKKYRHSKSEQFNRSYYSESDSRYAARVLSFKLFYNIGKMKERVKKSSRSIQNNDLK